MGSLNKDTNSETVIIGTADNQYRIEDPLAGFEDPWPDTEDGLTTGEDGWFAVLTGVEWGPLNVTFTLRSQPPSRVADGWDIVSQRPIHATNSTLEVVNTSLDRLHTLILPGGGWYTARVHARGRASRLPRGHHPGGQEEHLIQLWATNDRESAELLLGPDSYSHHYL